MVALYISTALSFTHIIVSLLIAAHTLNFLSFIFDIKVGGFGAYCQSKSS